MVQSDKGIEPSFWILRSYMSQKGLNVPCTVKVAFRNGRRKKVKSIRILELLSIQACECCGPIEYYRYSHNGKEFSTFF